MAKTYEYYMFEYLAELGVKKELKHKDFTVWAIGDSGIDSETLLEAANNYKVSVFDGSFISSKGYSSLLVALKSRCKHNFSGAFLLKYCRANKDINSGIIALKARYDIEEAKRDIEATHE